MTYGTTKRRRSPGWVRAMDDLDLHALGFCLRRSGLEADLSNAQEWLWSAVISELEYRRRQAATFARCHCELCVEPFDA